MKRSRTLLLALFLLTLLGVGLGIGANRVVARLLAIPPEELAKLDPLGLPGGEGATDDGPAARAPDHPRSLTRSQYIDGILRRNLFDSEFIARYNPNPEDEGGAGSDLAATELKLILVAVMVLEPSIYSVAYIGDEENEAAASGYNIGDHILDREVVDIQRRRVILRRADGSEERLDLGGEGPSDGGDGVASSSGGSSSGDGDVQEIGENKYAVSKRLIDEQMGDMDALSRMGRALLHRGPDGEYDGYRMSAIRRDTLPDKLGIKNGDIVHSVNGQPLTSVQGAMTAYQTLQNDRKFNFEVTRRGQRMTLEYELR